MSTIGSDLRRLASSAGLYAASGVAQQAAGFLLIPLYTRLIDPSSYGVLEVFNAFSSMGFACVTMGLTSAINKCFHRDCETAEEQSTVLSTAILLDLPVLLLAAALIVAAAKPISTLLTGTSSHADLLPLVAGASLCYSLLTLILAGLRAQERAVAFSTLSIAQFGLAIVFNLLLVARLGYGIRGIFLSNMLANAIVLPLAVATVRRGSRLAFSRRLVGPLLRFGLLLIPVMLASWVMDLSDRYVLRLYRGLDEVAIYGIGYKFGMLLQVAVVWPFQLAWPALSFSISKRPDHQATYARTLTYLVAVLALAVLVVSIAIPRLLDILVSTDYAGAGRVVPLIALAYAMNGVHYCASPGLHLAERTRYLTVLAALAAACNLALNLVLIPRFGMMGAAWSTFLAFLALAAATLAVGQSVYPVAYEWHRLGRIVGAAVLVFGLGTIIPSNGDTTSLVFGLALPLVVFPAVLLGVGFLDTHERGALQLALRRSPPA